MFSTLPIDIIDTIIIKLNYHPVELLELRNVNKLFREKINLIENMKELQLNDRTDKKLDELLRKNVSVESVGWLFDNNVQFKLKHVRTMIINNRIDLIQRGFFSQSFLKLIFNRFHINEDLSENVLYAAYECNNPIIVASKYNRVEIVKLLIEKASIGNPHTKVMNGLLTIAVSYNHKNLFCYLVTYHCDSIQLLLNASKSKIIYRMDDCEDIFFYMILNDKIEMDIMILLGCIAKNYKELFFYCYKNMKIKDRLKIIKKTIETNNYELFNYVLDDYNISKEILNETIFGKKEYTKEFLYNLINNHLPLIFKESDLIGICIINKVSDDIIIKLINEKFYYGDDEMAAVLSERRIDLLRMMCEKYKE